MDVPDATVLIIKERVVGKKNPKLVDQYFGSVLSNRALKEFKHLYNYSIKEFIYLMLINDFDSDEVYEWIDKYKYTRTSPPMAHSSVYSLESFEETPNQDNQYAFPVETKVVDSKELSTAGLPSAFLNQGYSLAKYRQFREAKRIKYYYRHFALINDSSQGETLIPKLRRMVFTFCSESLQGHQSRLYRKINSHFFDLHSNEEISKQIEGNHFKLRSVDQLKSFLKSEKQIHILVTSSY